MIDSAVLNFLFFGLFLSFNKFLFFQWKLEIIRFSCVFIRSLVSSCMPANRNRLNAFWERERKRFITDCYFSMIYVNCACALVNEFRRIHKYGSKRFRLKAIHFGVAMNLTIMAWRNMIIELFIEVFRSLSFDKIWKNQITKLFNLRKKWKNLRSKVAKQKSTKRITELYLKFHNSHK